MGSTESPKSLNTQELWEGLVNHNDFRKQRGLFTSLIGNPLWWLVTIKPSRKKKTPSLDPQTVQLWSDPRFSSWTCRSALLNQISKRLKSGGPFDVICRRHSLKTHCIPLISNRSSFHLLALSHLETLPGTKAALQLLYSNLKMLIGSVMQEAELKRLTESLRPRMVALSTVHTVHRLINTTLTLEELYHRLAHLTGQVLHAKECSIFIVEKTRQNKKLIERGSSPGFKKRGRGPRKIRSGNGYEGRTFSTARHLLRKNYLCVPLIDEDVIGVISLRGKKDPRGFDMFDKEILMTLAEEAVVAIKNAELYEEQKKVTLETIQSLGAIVGARFAPQRRIKSKTLLTIASLMADQMRLSADDRQAIQHATLLKDASKIGLPDAILKKQERLTGEEYQLVRQHPVHGARMIQSFKSLKPVAPILLALHENYDGSGYPHGLKGAQIPLGARILAVLNAFEALVGGRSYKRGIGIREALEELRRNQGTQFDPHVVNVFQKVIEKPRINRLLKSVCG